MTENQGISQQVACEIQILLSLLEQPMGAEQLVHKLQAHFAKATVYKYLGELFDCGLIEYESPTKKFGEIKRPYRLTVAGIKEAEKQGFIKALSTLPPETVIKILSNYKLLVAWTIVDKWIGRKSLWSTIEEKTILSYQKHVDAIEADLISYGFTDEEILKLWLINQGELLVNVFENLRCPNFFNIISDGFAGGSTETTENFEEYVRGIKQTLAAIK